jgi:hypothetical protein
VFDYIKRDAGVTLALSESGNNDRKEVIMKTVRVLKFNGVTIEIVSQLMYSREMVCSAIQILNKIGDVNKFRTQLTNPAYQHATQFIRELKAIVRNKSSTIVTIKYPPLNRSLNAYLKHTGNLAKWMGEYTFQTSLNPIREAAAHIKKRNDTIRHYRNRMSVVNIEEVTLNNNANTYEIRAQMIVGTSNFNRDTRNYYSFSRTVRVFVPGSLRNAVEARRARLVFLGKKPTTEERHISVEIEFGSKKDRNSLGAELFKAGVAKYVELKTDGSVRDLGSEYYPHEIAVCVPVSKRDEVIASVLKVINDSGAKVNKTCGLHVHLDMRGYDHTKAFSNLVSAQTILYQMIPASRRDNNFCKKTVNKSFAYHRNSSNRYQGINPCSFRKYKTIEVRLHSGTTDFTKITNFMDILSAVAYNETKIARASSTVAGFVKQHKLSDQIKEYISSRIKLFNSTVQEEVA